MRPNLIFNPRLSLASALFAAGLAACTLEPHYQRPAEPLSAPAPQALAEAAGVPAATGTAPAAADIGWRSFFPDPQLQQLIGLALANNRDLRVTALNVEAAQAQYRIQRADLLPTLNISGADQAQKTPSGVIALSSGGSGVSGASGISHYATLGVGFTSYELDFFGRIRSLDHAALQTYFAAIATQRSAELSLVAEVAQAYLAVLTDESLLKVTRDTLQSDTDTYQLTERSLKAGVSTELSLRQSQTALDGAKASVAQYERQLRQDRDALQLLLGTSIPRDIDTHRGLDQNGPLVSDLQEGIPSDVLVQRPDVIAAEHQLRSANADIGAARAAFLPRISLTGSFGTASTQLSGLFKDGSETWSFAPSISVPIFAAGANIANLQAAKVARATSVAQYEKAIQTAFQETADALAARSTLDDQLAAQSDLAQAADASLLLSKLRFDHGVDNYLSVLDAQRTQLSAQQTLQTLRQQRLDNLVTLYKVLGGGWRELDAQQQPRPPATGAAAAVNKAG